jgi:hypothetical protein
MFGSKVDSFTNPPLIENFDINFLRGIKTWIVGTFFSIYTAFISINTTNPNEGKSNNIFSDVGNAFKDAILGTDSSDSKPTTQTPKSNGASNKGGSPDMSQLMSQLGGNQLKPNSKVVKNSKVPSTGFRDIQARRQKEHSEKMLQQPQAQQQPWAGKLM